MEKAGIPRSLMPLDTRLEASPLSPPALGRQVVDALAAEAIEVADFTESPFYIGPARGIFNAVVIGTGAWTIILAGVALTRAFFFG
jgi:hypothetical protein